MSDPVPDSVAVQPDAPAAAPAALNLSLEPVHAPAPPSDQPSPQQRTAVLALMAHIQGAQPGGASMAPEAQQIERRLKARPAQRLFTAEAFGDALAAELETLAPGELRGYVLATDNHTIALSIQHTRRRAGGRYPTAWRIHLHDPDRKPANRQRMVCEPQRLRGARWRSLHAWFKTGCAPYFDTSPEIATLRSWDAPATPVTPHLHGFDKAAALRPAFLRAVMLAGDASQVRAAIAQGLAQLPSESAALLDFLQGRNGDGSALGLAMAQGRTDTVTAFVTAVGGARDEQLRQTSRHLLLRGAFGRLEGRTPALDAGTARRSPEGAIAYVRAVLALPRTAISDDHRADLAAARPAEGVALLHTLCSRAASTSEGIAPEHEFLYSVARAIAESVALTPRHKQALLAAKVSKGWMSSQTATRAALDSGHVHAAAAMVCAVIESNGDFVTKKALVAGMGTPPGEVLRALNHLSPVQKVRGQWKARIESAISGSGAPASTVAQGTGARR